MPEQTAVLVIDMLEDFIAPGAPLEVPAGRKIVPALAERLERARAEGTPVIYVCDAHAPDDPEFAVWPPHAIQGTEGAQVVGDLAPRPGERIVTKTSYSGFYETELEAELRSLGVDHLILTGVVTNICVLYTAADALMRGFTVTVPPDCVAGLNEEDHAFALRQTTDVLKPAQG